MGWLLSCPGASVLKGDNERIKKGDFDMALAEVTYNAGVSCRIGKYTFPLNRGVMVQDSSVIRRAQNTKGFSVNVIKRKTKKAKKTVAVEKTRGGKTKRATDKKRGK